MNEKLLIFLIFVIIIISISFIININYQYKINNQITNYLKNNENNIKNLFNNDNLLEKNQKILLNKIDDIEKVVNSQTNTTYVRIEIKNNEEKIVNYDNKEWEMKI